MLGPLVGFSCHGLAMGMYSARFRDHGCVVGLGFSCFVSHSDRFAGVFLIHIPFGARLTNTAIMTEGIVHFIAQ
jgi:hypothetical protein